MKIPKKVKIGPHIYEVKYEKDFWANHKAVAQSRHIKTTIMLDPAQSKSQLEDSFLHEILHCIDDQIKFTPKDEDEDSIRRLSPRLLEVLKDNNLLI